MTARPKTPDDTTGPEVRLSRATYEQLVQLHAEAIVGLQSERLRTALLELQRRLPHEVAGDLLDAFMVRLGVDPRRSA